MIVHRMRHYSEANVEIMHGLLSHAANRLNNLDDIPEVWVAHRPSRIALRGASLSEESRIGHLNKT
jgi:hypothetical protein